MTIKRNILCTLFLLCITLLFSSTSAFADNTESWVFKKDMTQKKGGHGSVGINGKIYTMGGCNNSENLNILEEYDPSTDTWKTKTQMLTARNAFGIAEANGKIYIIGGDDGNFLEGSSGKHLNTVEEYDPLTDTWTKKANMPTARSWCNAVTLDRKIYVVGGITSNSNGVGVVEEYDPSTDTWKTMKNFPYGAHAIGLGVVNGKMYAMGGDNSGKFFNTVEEYDALTDTWTKKANMPTPRDGHGVAVMNNKIYAIGGGNYTDYFKAVEEYDPSTDTWTKKADLLTGRHVCSAATVNGKLYAIGGLNKDGVLSSIEQLKFNDIEINEPENSANRALLLITLVSGLEKEYDMSMEEVNDFIDWYDEESTPSYKIDKDYNIGPFESRKDYIARQKIECFEVMEYNK